MILEITAAATVGAIAGFGVCAVLTAGKVSAATDWEETAVEQSDRAWEAEKAHARAADALATKQSRIDRALTQVTPGANATVQRIARILRGEA